MSFERVIIRLCRLCVVLGGSLGAIGAILIGTSVYLTGISSLGGADANGSACDPPPACDPINYTLVEQSPSARVESGRQNTRLSPAPLAPPLLEKNNAASGNQNPSVTPVGTGEILTTNAVSPPTRPGMVLTEAPPALAGTGLFEGGKGVISDTLSGAGSEFGSGPPQATITAAETPAALVADDSYTSTNQVHPRQDVTPEEKQAGAEMLSGQTLPQAEATSCPTHSGASFELIPILGPPADRPDFTHGDLNLTLRGYDPVPESAGPVLFEGPADLDSPQLAGLFQPNRGPAIQTVYRVHQWLWDPSQCGGNAQGCPGPLITDWEVTLAGLATVPGEVINIPERGAQIHPGGYKAMVLYAQERQITLAYTGRDTVAAGYVVHLIDVCVDPNLLALYRAQNNAAGRRVTGLLPALRNDQALGTAAGAQIKVAVRDNGSFMDPRSSKDWWQGYHDK